MHNGLKFQDGDGDTHAVSTEHPLPVTAGAPVGGLEVAGIGDPTDAAWDGVAASATVISLLKAIALNTATP